MNETTTTPEEDRTIPFEFKGKGSEYFKIWIVNLCLTGITLGIYSAWAKVRRNRYFYGNTALDGNSFEYLANPVSILKGRLIAFACFAVYTLIPHFMTWAKVGPINIFVAQGILFVLLMIALPWFIIRSLAFRARNTAYRNIRFNFKGSYLDALLNYALIPIVFVVTVFGITYLAVNDREFAKQMQMYILVALVSILPIYPYLLFRQKRMVVANSRYGASHFRFTSPVRAFYAVFGLLIFLSIVLVPIYFFTTMAIASAAKTAESPFTFIAIAYFWTAIVYTYYFAFYNAYIGNVTFNGIEIDGHKLRSNLSTGGLFKIYLTNILGIIFTLGLYIPWAKIRTVKYRTDHVWLLPAGALDQLVAGQQGNIGAAGEELGEMFDFDVSL